MTLAMPVVFVIVAVVALAMAEVVVAGVHCVEYIILLWCLFYLLRCLQLQRLSL